MLFTARKGERVSSVVSVENHGGSAFSFLHEICGFARYAAAVCFRKDGVPIGYVHIGADDSHDLGYALRSEFWRRGIASETCAAAIAQARAAGIPYLTATHDIDNPRSGAAMRRCGLQYQYTYKEQWQPKNFPVSFRMYQLNLHCAPDFVYRKYWEQAENRWIEPL